LKNKIVAEVDKAPIPIGISSIARAVGVSWNRVARLALALAAEDKIAGIPTSNGWVFMSRKRIKIDEAPLPEETKESPQPPPSPLTEEGEKGKEKKGKNGTTVV
jgi:hypothetical protein